LCCRPFAGRVDSAGRTQAESIAAAASTALHLTATKCTMTTKTKRQVSKRQFISALATIPSTIGMCHLAVYLKLGTPARGLGVAHWILRCAAGMDSSGQKVPTQMKVRVPRNRVRLNPRADRDTHQASVLGSARRRKLELWAREVRDSRTTSRKKAEGLLKQREGATAAGENVSRSRAVQVRRRAQGYLCSNGGSHARTDPLGWRCSALRTVRVRAHCRDGAARG
jgi:hypothetical protein